MFNHYISAFKNYAVFQGRATRSQYWYFVLFNIIISVALGIIEISLGLGDEDGGPITGLYSLIVLIPSIAVAIRRIHDSDKSGWWILLPFYNLYLLIRKGTEGPNRFGLDPKNPEAISDMPAAEAVNTDTDEAPVETMEHNQYTVTEETKN